MKKIIILFLISLFVFGCIETQKEDLELSVKEISYELGKNKLQEAKTIGIIMDSRNITQENFVKVIECAVGYSRSLGELNKTIISYGIENEICLNEELGETSLSNCSKHIKENVDYNIYLVRGNEAATIFYEDNMKIVVPENNIVECKIK